MLTMLRADVIKHTVRYEYAYIPGENHEFPVIELKVSEGMSAPLLGCANQDLGESLLETNRFNYHTSPCLGCRTLSYEHRSRGNDDEKKYNCHLGIIKVCFVISSSSNIMQ